MVSTDFSAKIWMLRDCFTTDYLISPRASILAPFPKWLDWTKILAQLNCRVIWFVCEVTWKSHVFNQYQPKHIIYTVWSNFSDLTRPHTNGGLVREVPLFQGNLLWWNIVLWPRYSTNHHSHVQSVWFPQFFVGTTHLATLQGCPPLHLFYLYHGLLLQSWEVIFMVGKWVHLLVSRSSSVKEKVILPSLKLTAKAPENWCLED